MSSSDIIISTVEAPIEQRTVAVDLVGPGAALALGAAETARLSRVEIEAILAALQLASADYPDTAFAWQDIAGRLAMRVKTDNTVQIIDLTDANGEHVYSMLADARSDIVGLQAETALLVPSIERVRLKRALYDALNGVPVMASDPVTWTIGASGGSPTIAGTTIAKEDSRIRLLGAGVWLSQNAAGASTYPFSILLYPKGTTYSATSRIGNVDAFEFVVGTGPISEFEFLTRGDGGGLNYIIEINGVQTSLAGYVAPLNSSGALPWIKVALSTSLVAGDRVRVYGASRSFGGLRIPTGTTITTATPRIVGGATLTLIGDSITEGAVATSLFNRFAARFRYFAGVDDVVVSGTGGRGYLDSNLGAAYNFRQRIQDVLTSKAGGLPDGVIVAGGVNDTEFTAAAVGAEALLYFQAIRAAAPNMPIFVLGPFWGNENYEANVGAYRDAIFAAANQVSRTHTIDTTNWITAGNKAAYISGDGIHPTDAGHAYYATKLTDAYRAIVGGF